MLVNAPDEMKQGLPRGVKAMVAGAAPASMIEGMEQMGFDLIHVCQLRNWSATVCARAPRSGAAWTSARRARADARRGVRYHLQRVACSIQKR